MNLSLARRALMAPHSQGEAESYTSAFRYCAKVLNDMWGPMPRDELDREARTWAATIERIMDTTGIEDPSGRGTYTIRAEQLTADEKREFLDAVDGLADWFLDQRRARESGG